MGLILNNLIKVIKRLNKEIKLLMRNNKVNKNKYISL